MLQWDGLENKTTVVVYAGGALVALWLSSTIVGAINSVPLVCPSYLMNHRIGLHMQILRMWLHRCIGPTGMSHCASLWRIEREAQAFGPLDDLFNLVGRGYDFGPLSLYSSQRLWSWLGLPTLGGLFTGTCSSRYIGTTSPCMALLKTCFVSRVGINCRFVSFSQPNGRGITINVDAKFVSVLGFKCPLYMAAVESEGACWGHRGFEEKGHWSFNRREFLMGDRQ